MKIADLYRNYGLLSTAVRNLSDRFLRSSDPNAKAYGTELDRTWRATRTEEEVNGYNYILLGVPPFTAPDTINFLTLSGLTPEKIKQQALADTYLHSIILKTGLYIDESTVLTNDNMVQILKALLSLDYEGQL